MANGFINTNKLKEMFINGAKFVAKECEYINELNVFPVPDGDTGTNLKITIEGACNSIRLVEHTDICSLGKQFARGLLMNARGNSGVIFSQIIKGFSNGLKEGVNEIGVNDLILCFSGAVKTAYESVVTPVEGTILTVIREATHAIKSAKSIGSVEDLFKELCENAKISLEKTPEILPELKEAGVVDSGGYGLYCFLNGMYEILMQQKNNHEHVEINNPIKVQKKSSIFGFGKEEEEEEEEGFGYCTEFIMILNSKVSISQKNKDEFDLKDFKKSLSRCGNSLVVVVDEEIVKVHIHTIRPYEVLEKASQFGEFSKVKIENMTLQFLRKNPGTVLETLAAKKKAKTNLVDTTKIIATVSSPLFVKIYRDDLKIDNTIDTTTNGNPSIGQFLELIRATNSKNIVIVIDNSNIALAAKEAIKLTPRDIKIDLLKADDQATSYLVCSEYDQGLDYGKNLKNMQNMIDHASSAKISYSTKNTELYGVKIRRNEFVGIFKNRVLVSSKSMSTVCKKMVDKVVDEVKHPKTAYIIYGNKALLEDVELTKKYINEKHLLQAKTMFSNQNLYMFYIGVK
jgi:DAK2 domain fusion protein YloV